MIPESLTFSHWLNEALFKGPNGPKVQSVTFGTTFSEPLGDEHLGDGKSKPGDKCTCTPFTYVYPNGIYWGTPRDSWGLL